MCPISSGVSSFAMYLRSHCTVRYGLYGHGLYHYSKGETVYAHVLSEEDSVLPALTHLRLPFFPAIFEMSPIRRERTPVLSSVRLKFPTPLFCRRN